MNRKFSILAILVIFAVPMILYYGFKATPDKNSVSLAQAIGSKPVVIDFSSQLCLECKELAKTLDPIEKNYTNKIVFKKVIINTATPEEEALMKKYKVTVVPTLVFLDKKGNVYKRTEGALPKQELEGYLNQLSKQ